MLNCASGSFEIALFIPITVPKLKYSCGNSMANDVKRIPSVVTSPPMTAASRVERVWQKLTIRGDSRKETATERENRRPGEKRERA